MAVIMDGKATSAKLRKAFLEKVNIYEAGSLEKEYSYRAKAVPATPKVVAELQPEQMSLL